MSDFPDPERHWPPHPEWWPPQLGKRAVGILGCAYIWIWLGIGNLNNANAAVRPGVIYLMLNPDVRAALWIVPGLLAAAVSMSRRLSWIGLGVLVIPPVAVVVSYGYAWALFLLGGDGYGSGYFQAAIYGTTIGMVVYVAYQPSPPLRIVAAETITLEQLDDLAAIRNADADKHEHREDRS